MSESKPGNERPDGIMVLCDGCGTIFRVDEAIGGMACPVCECTNWGAAPTGAQPDSSSSTPST